MAAPTQLSLADLGTPLHAVPFVVVDVETTGGSPRDSRITEVGAVRISGGEMSGEFATLVDPGVPIPPAISALTGITSGMLAGRPPLEAVLPAFLEFCRGAVLVAHNARFDVGFLNANLARLDYPRLSNPVVCTAGLARRLLREEVRNCRLATLAVFFATRTQPVHRALADARATVEVFHGLLERAGSFGVLTLEDLVDFARVRNTPLFKARRHLADGLPAAPGVYAFRSAAGEILYVGKATDLRARVRSYFGNDDRRKVVDLLKEAAAVDHWECPTPLEAAVREVRLIAAHRPRFNRRSKHPERAVWLKLTPERYPRLAVVRAVRDDGGAYVGPLGSRRIAEQVADAISDVVPLRRCTARIGARTRFAPCALAELGRCLSPCDASITPDAYEDALTPLRAALAGDASTLVRGLLARVEALAAAARYEEAAATRDRLGALTATVARARRAARLAAAEQVVAWRPVRRERDAEVALVRRGRLVATAACPRSDLESSVARLLAEAPTLPPAGPEAAEELDLVGRWLDEPAIRLVTADGVLAEPVAGGALLADVTARLRATRRATGRPDAELAAKRTRRPALK
jgi:DNA polymerase-3 subunit epsilon